MREKNVIEQLAAMPCTAPKQGAKIRAYIHRELPPVEVEAFETHLDDCEKCSKIIFLEDYLRDQAVVLLKQLEWAEQEGANGRAIAATH